MKEEGSQQTFVKIPEGKQNALRLEHVALIRLTNQKVKAPWSEVRLLITTVWIGMRVLEVHHRTIFFV